MIAKSKGEAATPQSPVLSGTSGVLKFGTGGEFHQDASTPGRPLFHEHRATPRDCPQMYLKTAVVLGWFVASYVLLVFFAGSWWLALPLAISLGLSMAAVGFDIQHDGGHQAIESPWINRLMARSLDLMGGSSYFWARKHNAMHHSYTNITGHDDDIDLGFLAACRRTKSGSRSTASSTFTCGCCMAFCR